MNKKHLLFKYMNKLFYQPTNVKYQRSEVISFITIFKIPLIFFTNQ